MELNEYDQALVDAVAKIETERDDLLLALERVLPFLTGNYWPGVEADAAVDFAIATARKARERKTPNVEHQRVPAGTPLHGPVGPRGEEK